MESLSLAPCVKVGKNSFQMGENLKGHHLMVEEFLGGVGEVICIMGTRVCKKGMGDVSGER